jgi:hypothetical protein
MTIAAFTRRLMDLGASAEIIAIAVEAVTLASRDCHVTSRVTSRVTEKRSRPAHVNSVAGIRLRHNENSRRPKQTMGSTNVTITRDERDASRDAVTPCTTLLPSLSLNLEGSIEEGSSVSKKARSENARARGQRMLAGAILTDEFRQAAIDLGADAARRSEHVG